LYDDQLALTNSFTDHHTSLVIHFSTKVIGANAYFDYPPRFDHGFPHFHEPVPFNNPIATKVEDHENLHELPTNHVTMNCYDPMVNNDKVVFPRLPLDSNPYTFEVDSDPNYDDYDHCDLACETNFLKGEDDIR